MEEGVDTGPIYYKKLLSLHGSAHDIYKRAGRLCWDMISDFIKENPTPVPQQGAITNFKRRMPEQSRIPEGLSLNEMYNYIRMLDAPGYPKAFIDYGNYRLLLNSAEIKNGKLTASIKMENRDE
jgi:methionyl-tRNA formyltransferase